MSMIAQEVYDKMVAHLRKQGKRSVDADYNCMYRSPEGLQCAVGCLIEPEEYNEVFENRSFDFIFDRCPSFATRIGRMNSNIMGAIQILHDDTDVDVKHWEKHFQDIAKLYKLIYKPKRVTL